MLKAKVYNIDGSVKEEIDIPAGVFGVKVNRELIHRVLMARFSSKRQPTAHTKTRGNVRGGGKKPWKQKGTGRARHSSIRSPLWKGGGVVFGPLKTRSWDRKVNLKAMKKAFACAISSKFKTKKLIFVDAFILSQPKTKEFMSTWKSFAGNIDAVRHARIGVLKKGNELLLVSEGAHTKQLIRASRNIPAIKIVSAQEVPLEDVVGYRYIVLEQAAISTLAKRCAGR